MQTEPNFHGADTDLPNGVPPRIQLPPALEQAQRGLVDLNERAITFVRERPVACLFGAVALGFIVGKIAARY